MANLKNSGRQYLLAAEQVFDTTDIAAATAGVLQLIPALPSNAVLIRGGVLIETAFNAGTASTLNVGLVGGSATAFGTALNLKQAAGTFIPLTGVPYKDLSGADITLAVTETGGASTAGSARVVFEYIVIGRANEVAE